MKVSALLKKVKIGTVCKIFYLERATKHTFEKVLLNVYDVRTLATDELQNAILNADVTSVSADMEIVNDVIISHLIISCRGCMKCA